MVDLPKKKVGIIACSGEELPEGTVTRLAALKVLEQLRPEDTVTICLPLFLAGGEGDRAFARFYPTIAVDGCELRCAARGTERYSGKPAAGLVVSELVQARGLAQPHGLSRLDAAGLQAVDALADEIAAQVDRLLDRRWDRRGGYAAGAAGADLPAPDSVQLPGEMLLPVLNHRAPAPQPDSGVASGHRAPDLRPEPGAPVQATCACGSGIPVQTLQIDGQPVTLIALPLLMEQLRAAGAAPGAPAAAALLEQAAIYNAVPAGAEPAYRAALLQAYTAYCEKDPGQ
ncbi:MAG: putative zinc-binding protein [Chloroflexota bacterium]